MLGGVLLTLWLALRSFRMIFAILVTLFVGPGHDHGAGPDGGGRVQHHLHRLHRLVRGAGRGFRHPVLRCAIAASVSTITIWPRRCATPGAAWACRWRWRRWRPRWASSRSCPPQYTGVAELGLVAGMGMIVAFLLSHHLLPALLMLLNPPGEAEDVGFPQPGAAGRFHDPATPQTCCASRPWPARCALVLMPVPAIRFQSAGSAQPQGGIGLDPVRPDEESRDLAQHHRCAGAVAGRRPMRWRPRIAQASRWWPRP